MRVDGGRSQRLVDVVTTAESVRPDRIRSDAIWARAASRLFECSAVSVSVYHIMGPYSNMSHDTLSHIDATHSEEVKSKLNVNVLKTHHTTTTVFSQLSVLPLPLPLSLCLFSFSL